MGVLYVVATPIGNLEDITVRALKILRSVDIIACEDTRKTRILTSKYHIKTRLVPYHEYNKKQAAPGLVKRLASGDSVALVSEAGTPLVSDPGSYLVRLCVENGLQVIPIPGPSSALAAISASGLDVSEFTFIGFLPKKDGKRRRLIERLKNEKRTFILFEPGRTVEKLLSMIESIPGDVKICYAKELTKVYEYIRTCNLKELKQEIQDRPELLKGEITIVVEPLSEKDAASKDEEEPVRENKNQKSRRKRTDF